MKSPWLEQLDDKETARIREWFNRARNIGVRETARNVKKVGIKQMPEKDFIRYLGDVVEWTADVSPWVENQRRLIEEAREKKDQVQAENLSDELRDKLEVIKSIHSIVELHESVYPPWADKVSGGFAEQVREMIDNVKEMTVEEEASRIRLQEEKLAELKSLGGVEVRIRIEANSAKDSYERAHGMTIDRILREGFWDIQEDAVMGTGATPFTHEETVILIPSPHYLIYGNSGGWGDLIWNAKVYIDDKREGQGKVSKKQFMKVTFTIPKKNHKSPESHYMRGCFEKLVNRSKEGSDATTSQTGFTYG